MVVCVCGPHQRQGNVTSRPALDYTERPCLDNRKRNKASPRGTERNPHPTTAVCSLHGKSMEQRSEAHSVPVVQTPNKPSWVNRVCSSALLPGSREPRVAFERAAPWLERHFREVQHLRHGFSPHLSMTPALPFETVTQPSK